MAWYRVELDANGGVASCRQVSRSETKTATVRYVRAESRKKAIEFALAWHARRKEHQRKSSARLHAERRAAGACIRCGQPLSAESRQFCDKHLAERREYRVRYAAGEIQPRKAGDAVAMHQREVLLQRTQYKQTEPLPRILARYDALDGHPSRFRDWLLEEIADVEARHPVPG